MQPYYQDELCTIYHGDWESVLPVVAISCDLVLTDPPYGIGVTRMQLGNGKRRVYREEDRWDDTAPNLTPLLGLAPNVCIWGGNHFDLPISRGWLVWDKRTGANSFADCELAWTNRKAAIRKFTHSWVGRNARERGDPDRYHPTQKPVALMEWCIGLFGTVGLILDPYMGAGSTLLAARNLGIQCVGVEREERYCEAAALRLQQQVLPLAS